MAGETDLKTLLKTMSPTVHQGDYVFCSVKNLDGVHPSAIISLVKEDEGVSLILERSQADALNIPYSFISSWITLKVHSSLEAFGLTAAFSRALADANIGCNVVAGYYHDHIFVNKSQAVRALEVLKQLSGA
ncbi:MAG: ACT domain-containing protein [Bacteroidota bacterium]